MSEARSTTANRFLELLSSGRPIVADGAMGTSLMAAGLEAGEVPETWVVRPDRRGHIRRIHEAYVEAGARIVLTNSFGASPIRLRIHDLQERAAELNEAAAELTREAVGDDVVVAGSMGPVGEFIAPLGILTAGEAAEAFAIQAAALAAGGVDVIWIETMADLAEVRAAVEGARRGAPGLPIVTTMTFDSHGRTMMGTWPKDAAIVLDELGAAALGANCGTGPAEIENAIGAMHGSAPEAILVAKGNAGVPRFEGVRTVYDMTPADAAAHARRALALGARIVGGCCGTTPDHVREIAAVVAQAVAEA
ncbi:MAG TPA: homocysteine S-methyltransferase family protein [Candidatus Limnocylindrales bacterium]